MLKLLHPVPYYVAPKSSPPARRASELAQGVETSHPLRACKGAPAGRQGLHQPSPPNGRANALASPRTMRRRRKVQCANVARHNAPKSQSTMRQSRKVQYAKVAKCNAPKSQNTARQCRNVYCLTIYIVCVCVCVVACARLLDLRCPRSKRSTGKMDEVFGG